MPIFFILAIMLKALIFALSLALIPASTDVMGKSNIRRVRFNPEVNTRLIPTRAELALISQEAEDTPSPLIRKSDPGSSAPGNLLELFPFPDFTSNGSTSEFDKTEIPRRGRSKAYFDESDFEFLGGSLTDHLEESIDPLSSLEPEEIDEFLHNIKDLGCVLYSHLSDKVKTAKTNAVRSIRTRTLDGVRGVFGAFCSRFLGYDLTPLDDQRITEILESGQVVSRCIEFVHSICVPSSTTTLSP